MSTRSVIIVSILAAAITLGIVLVGMRPKRPTSADVAAFYTNPDLSFASPSEDPPWSLAEFDKVLDTYHSVPAREWKTWSHGGDCQGGTVTLKNGTVLEWHREFRGSLLRLTYPNGTIFYFTAHKPK